MQIGLIGLGRMGMNMGRRLIQGKHRIIAYNRTRERTRQIAKEGAQGAFSLPELVQSLKPPRILWLMLPAGKPVDQHIEQLQALLSHGDIIVDGGNSFYQDDIRRAQELKPYGIHYLDVGVSGGVWGLKIGYCLMIGGDRKIFRHLRPIFKTLAPKEGYLYCGEAGAGHFVKMIHNGIEYGMMSAYGEGFDLLQASPYGKQLDFGKVAHLWNQGSVIRSWLLELLEAALRADKDLSAIKGFVEDSGEGRWMVRQALESAVPAPVIAASLFQRFRSRQTDPFSDRILAALRNQFGGHRIYKRTAGVRREKEKAQGTRLKARGPNTVNSKR